MIQEEEDARLRADVREPASGIQRIPYITILAGVGLSVLFLNTGILSLFFLLLLAMRYWYQVLSGCHSRRLPLLMR